MAKLLSLRKPYRLRKVERLDQSKVHADKNKTILHQQALVRMANFLNRDPKNYCLLEAFDFSRRWFTIMIVQCQMKVGNKKTSPI